MDCKLNGKRPALLPRSLGNAALSVEVEPRRRQKQSPEQVAGEGGELELSFDLHPVCLTQSSAAPRRPRAASSLGSDCAEAGTQRPQAGAASPRFCF